MLRQLLLCLRLPKHPVFYSFFTVSATDLRERFLLLGSGRKRRISLGVKGHMPPLTYLICLLPKDLYTVGSV